MTKVAGLDEPLLPSPTPWERAQSLTSARVLATDADIIRRARDPAATPSGLAPWLAGEKSLHHYAPGDDAGNRARIASAFADHLGYGSPAALEAEIALDAGVKVRVVEAHDDAGLKWPDFAVDALIANGDPAPDTAAILASALRRKNVRDWPVVRSRVATPGSEHFIAAASNIAIVITVRPPPPEPQAYAGAAARIIDIITFVSGRA